MLSKHRARERLRNRWPFVPTLLVSIGVSVVAHGQGAPRIQPPPPGSPLPGIAEPEEPRLAPGLPLPERPSPPPIAPEGVTHQILNVAIDGVTAFGPETTGPLIAGLTGPAVSQGQVESSRRALVDLYRSEGFVYTTVRAVISGTDLRFVVTEGYVADVKLDGDVGPAGLQVLRFLNHVVGQVPLRTTQLERWLLLAQDIPGLTVKSVLNPSLGDPGALTLVAQVSRQTLSGYISADNRAFKFSGPEEGLVVLNVDSLTEFGERTQVSLFGTFDNTDIFGQISEEVFLGGSGLKFKLYGGEGRATPSGPLHDIGYDGVTRVFGGQFSYPVLRTRDQSLNILASFDATESDVQEQASFTTPVARANFDSLRILRFGANYALLDTWLGPARSATSGISGKVSQGLNILGASNDAEAGGTPPRLGEITGFTKFSGELSRTQTLFHPFGDASVALAGAMGGQYSSNVLPPSEKYYLGGPTFNRGYYYGEVSGDKAFTVGLELQLNTPLPVPAKVPFELRSQFYVFYDWGTVWQNNAPLEADETLRSAGLGVRLFAGRSTEFDLEGVYRITLYPNGSGPDISALTSAAFYWQIVQRF